MSIDVMNLVWRSTLEGSSKRFVLLALADRADDDGYCWPGMQNLIDKTGLSESTIKRARRELEADRLLLQEERWTRFGDRDTNGYWINIEALQRMQRPRASERGPHPMEAEGTPGGWGHGEPTPGHGEPRGGAMVDPITSVQTADGLHKDLDQKNSADAASRQAATAPQQPKRPPLFDPPFVEDRDDPKEWVEETLIGGFDAGEDLMADSMLGRGCHPYHVVNAISAKRYGSTDKSTYRKGRDEALARIAARIGGLQGNERQDAMDLLVCRYGEDEIVWQILNIYRPHLSAA